jgi:hypothetical protein
MHFCCSRFARLPFRETLANKFSTYYFPSNLAALDLGMRHAYLLLSLATVLGAQFLAASDCIPIGEASQHVGEDKCIVGKVLRVKVGPRGVHFVSFCAEQAACPFAVVVFPHDLKDVGDVRWLEGRVIEIHGPVKLYDGRAEIILNRVNQITGGSTLIPPMPKNYDVEKQGHYSAGRMRPPKKLKTAKIPVSPSTTYGDDVDGEGPQ